MSSHDEAPTRDHYDEPDNSSTLQERHPDWPKMNVSFYFAPHSNAADMEGIDQYLEDADVLLYENVGRNEKLKNFYESLAATPAMNLDDALDKKANGRPIRGTHMEPLVRGLHESGLAVGTLDIGKDDDELQLGDDIFMLREMEFPKYMEYDQALDFLMEVETELTQRQQRREQIMADRFEDEIVEILDKRSDLKQKKDLNVVISMGAMHTALQREFAARGISSDRHFNTKGLHLYGYADQLQRTIRYEKVASRDLLERALTENIIGAAVDDAIEPGGLPDSERVEYIRRYISELDTDEMETVFLMWDSGEGSVDELNEVLESFGRPALAKSSQEIINANEDSRQHRKKIGGGMINAVSKQRA